VSKVDLGMVAYVLASRIAQSHLRLVGTQIAEYKRSCVDLVDELVLAHGWVLLFNLLVTFAQLLLHHQLILVFGGHVRHHVTVAGRRTDVADAFLCVCLVRIVTPDELGNLTTLHLTCA
jgi:hypothetical protein